MLSAKKWWGVITNYNESVFPFQLIMYGIGIVIVGYLFLKPGQKSNTVLKSYFGFSNLFIGIVFFNILGKDFPVPLRQIQGALFVIIGALFLMDLYFKKTVFRIPVNRRIRFVTIGFLLLVLLYPVVGLLSGRSLDQLIFPGALPCPTTALALVLLAACVKKANKPVYFLLLIWAIPFPPMIQIPKYHVYEDFIMFVIGLYALGVMLFHILRTRRGRSMKAYKHLFNVHTDSVFATSSPDGVPNIVPIHSKHLVPGNKVLISNQFMNKTKKNVMDNPKGTLMIKESKQLYKISGSCRYKTSGFLYRMAVRGVKKYAREQAKNKAIALKCNGIVLMKVNRVVVEDLVRKE